MNVLVVDDDEITRDMLEHTLSCAGYQVTTASNGREALDLLKQGAARLVISDWEMPEMTGIELCEAVRSGDFDGYIYIMLLTSRSEQDAIVTGMSAGADDFIAKPFHKSELLVRLRAGVRILGLETRDLAIFALAKLAESRDLETGHHLERVQLYSRALATHLAQESEYASEIDSDLVRLIYLTSPLHDIGKVGVPDGILRKPGRLTKDEMHIMQSHCRIGYETLDAALNRFPDARFLRIAREITATHHERWDGKGYPNGLAGTRIPLCGRIVALADVYDALISRRCYKEPMSHEESKAIIVQQSGKHFDPIVVKSFLAIEQNFQDIAAQYSADSAEVPELAELVDR